jgi:homoserine O-acetyltransferase
MDLFDLRDRPATAMRPRLTFVGIENDWLFPRHYIEAAALRYASSGYTTTYRMLPTEHGHDAFLAEAEALADLLVPEIRAPEIDAPERHSARP